VDGFDSKTKPLCHVTSDETGRFLFPALSPAEYSLVPYYAGSRTKFDVRPSELQFTVSQDSLILPQEFKVTGFTISGKVMASIKPLIPLPGAKVYLSKKQIAVTDNNGAYKTDNVKAKQYMLHAEASKKLFKYVNKI
jgi:protocatechuate 3,4-dioxygenase beta subunit